MIKLDNEVIDVNKFPDGTLRLNPDLSEDKSNHSREATITWYFENNEEMVALMFLTRHLQNNGIPFVHLVMPYIPNVRQDRVKSIADVFTLKYFAEFINNLCFSTVTVLDPHSSVSAALFDNIIIETPNKYIDKVFSVLYELPENNGKIDTLMAFYPDEGAMKRYSGLTSLPYAFGIKRRDWATGNIEGLDVAGEANLIKGRNVLIIDDISSRGGTFYHSAKKLKELGANHIYLYVTHCEHTIFEGAIFKSGLIDKVFTTNSIFGEKEKEHANMIPFKEAINDLNIVNLGSYTKYNLTLHYKNGLTATCKNYGLDLFEDYNDSIWLIDGKGNTPVEVTFNVGNAEFDTKKMVYRVDADDLNIYYDNDECCKEFVDCAKQTEVDCLTITRVPSKNIHYLV